MKMKVLLTSLLLIGAGCLQTPEECVKDGMLPLLEKYPNTLSTDSYDESGAFRDFNDPEFLTVQAKGFVRAEDTGRVTNLVPLQEELRVVLDECGVPW